MSRKQKYYVVWHGAEPGIYSSWQECQKQTNGFENAQFKSFDTEEEARRAYYDGTPEQYIHPRTASGRGLQAPPTDRTDTVLPLPPEVKAEAIAVDAACSGNPGPMEYRGIDLRTGEVLFHYGPIFGTNNIGEYLAIVHALAKLTLEGKMMTVYSDSRNALQWIEKKQCRTKLVRNKQTEQAFQLADRATLWLKNHTWQIPVIKWDTKRWGEIPADFGRK